jgi:gamma-F420-2:alpha-L-glutamate ligase
MIHLTYNIPYEVYNGSFKQEETNLFFEYCKRENIKIETSSPMYNLTGKIIPTAYYNMNGFVNASHQRLARRLELQGVKHLNNVNASLIADDKFLSSIELKYHGIPVPKILDVNQIFGISQNYGGKLTQVIKDEIKFPCVIKVSNGGYGNGICLIENETQFNDWFSMTAWVNPKFGYNESGADFLVQEFIANSRGRALRIHILDGEYLGCMYRDNQLSWKVNSNISGSTPTKYDADPELIQMCVKSLEVLNLRHAGVDILFDDNGYTINEINSSPGFVVFNNLFPEVNLPKRLIDALIE